METSDENTSSFCIFCLNHTENFTDDCDNNSKSDRYKFFTLITRHFLNNSALISAENQDRSRNACKLISEITINGDDSEQFFDNVQICSKCEKITEKFSDLYYQMKELELRIDWEVDKLKDVMGCADRMVSRLEKDWLEKTSSNGSVLTLREFRNVMKQSCQAYQDIKKLTVPKLQLTQMIVEVEDSPIGGLIDDDLQISSECVLEISNEWPISPSEIPDYPMQHDAQEYPTQPETHHEYLGQPDVNGHQVTLTEEVEVMQHDQDQPTNAKFSDCPVVANSENDLSSLLSPSLPETATPLILQEEDPLNPPTNSDSTYICSTSTCSLLFTSKFELFQHNMANHISKYFNSVQQSEIPNDRFNQLITNLLETTLEIFAIVEENYTCPFCGNQFPGREKARNHLVVKHRPMLKEKLVELQKSECDLRHNPQSIDSSISITDDSMKSTLKRKSGRSFKGRSILNCSACSRSFPSKRQIFQHNMFNHPEKHFASVKSELLTPHQFQNCVAHMLSTTVEEFQKVGSKYKCIFCGQLMSVKQYIQSHLVRKHREVLKSKLVELQNSSSINMIMNTSRRTNKVKSLSGRRDKRHNHICITCGKVFQQKILFNHHQKANHPEIFFETSNLLPSSSSENNEQFKTYVRYVLEQQIQVPIPQQGDQVKCGICTKVSNKRYYAKIHLISRHRVFVAEKLKEVQNSGKSIHEVRNELLRMKGVKMKTGSDSHYESQSACNICGKMYKNGHVLHSHQTIYHPEIFFENGKPTALVQMDNEGNQLFSKYVRHIMAKHVDQEFAKIHAAEGDGTIKYKCNFCSKCLCNRTIAIKHLVLRHTANMAEILEDLRGKTVGEIKLEMQSDTERNRPTSTFNCSLCSKYFQTEFGHFQHDLCYHIEKYFSSVKLEVMSNEQFKKLIGEAVKNYVENFERIDSKYKCSFCSKQFSGSQAARNHLLIKHHMIIKDKLVEVQNSGTFSQQEESSIPKSNATGLKRKRGWPKGKPRLLRKSSSKFNFKFGNPCLKTKRGRGRPRGKGVIDHAPVCRSQRVPKVTRCGRCGKSFANVYTLRTHLKGYCKVVRNLDEDSAKVGVELVDDSGIADVL